MKVKKLAKKIEGLNVKSCGSCPFFDRSDCKLHTDMCVNINSNIDTAKGILQLEKFFKEREEE